MRCELRMAFVSISESLMVNQHSRFARYAPQNGSLLHSLHKVKLYNFIHSVPRTMNYFILRKNIRLLEVAVHWFGDELLIMTRIMWSVY